MEELRLADVAACVVGWHNRHPLARRIGASHVHAIGYVALPFSGGGAPVVAPAAGPEPEAEGGTLRERAEKRAKQAQEPPVVVELALDRKTLKPAFSEDFIDPLPPRAVARFAQAHAQALARAPADGPLRNVRADGEAPLMLYLMTAVVETGTRKSRVLVSGGARPQVLGRRVLQPQRVALATLPLWLLGAAGVVWLPRGGGGTTMLAAAPAASAAVARPASASAAASATVAAPAWAPASTPAAAGPAASGGEPAASAPEAAPLLAAVPASAAQDGDPHLGRINLPSIKPRLNARAAAAEDAASAAAVAERGPAPAPANATAAAHQAPAAPAAAAPAPSGHSFALSTRPLRTRAEADQTRVAMRALLQAVDTRGVHVDVLPEGDDWRVVGLPFTSRSEADKARALLVSRGMKVQVVAF